MLIRKHPSCEASTDTTTFSLRGLGAGMLEIKTPFRLWEGKLSGVDAVDCRITGLHREVVGNGICRGAFGEVKVQQFFRQNAQSTISC